VGDGRRACAGGGETNGLEPGVLGGGEGFLGGDDDLTRRFSSADIGGVGDLKRRLSWMGVSRWTRCPCGGSFGDWGDGGETFCVKGFRPGRALPNLGVPHRAGAVDRLLHASGIGEENQRLNMRRGERG